jgi:hypothetical protein
MRYENPRWKAGVSCSIMRNSTIYKAEINIEERDLYQRFILISAVRFDIECQRS